MSPVEVEGILKKLGLSEAKLLQMNKVSAAGLCEVVVSHGGKVGIFYLDESKRYAISGAVLDFQKGINLTQERLRQVAAGRRLDVAAIPLQDALVMGEGAKRVIVFTDPACSYCRVLHGEMKTVVTQRKDIAFYIKLAPRAKEGDGYLRSHHVITRMSLQALDEAYAEKPVPPVSGESRQLDDNMELARTLGISGTPTMVFADGSLHVGYLPADELVKRIDRVPEGGKR